MAVRRGHAGERRRVSRERCRQRAGRPPRNNQLVVGSVGQVLFVDTATIDWIEADDYSFSLYDTSLRQQGFIDIKPAFDACAPPGNEIHDQQHPQQNAANQMNVAKQILPISE